VDRKGRLVQTHNEKRQFGSGLQQKAHHHCMVFERSQRGFLLLEVSLGTRCGQSLLFELGNSLLLLRYARLAIRNELVE
jgi:hypothetical protein